MSLRKPRASTSFSAYANKTIRLNHMNIFNTYVLYFRGHASGIFFVLEKSLDGLPASRHVIHVFLRSCLLLFGLAKFLLKLVTSIDCVSDCFDVKQLALAPVIKVEVWVLQVHFQTVFFLEFLVSKYHLVLLTFNIVRQVELLVLVKNTEEVVVVGVVLRFILHKDSNLLLHFFE